MLNYLHVVLTRVWDIYTLLDAGYLDVGSNHGPIPPCWSPHFYTCWHAFPFTHFLKQKRPLTAAWLQNYTFQLMMAYPHDISTDSERLGLYPSLISREKHRFQCSKFSIFARVLLTTSQASLSILDAKRFAMPHLWPWQPFLRLFHTLFANIPYSCFFCVRPFLNPLFGSSERQTSSVSANWLT